MHIRTLVLIHIPICRTNIRYPTQRGKHQMWSKLILNKFILKYSLSSIIFLPHNQSEINLNDDYNNRKIFVKVTLSSSFAIVTTP